MEIKADSNTVLSWWFDHVSLARYAQTLCGTS
jgi:hypothetical protein